MTTDLDQDLEWSEYIKALRLHQYLDRNYPDWQGYDIDIDLDKPKESNLDEEPEIPEVDLDAVSVDIDS